MITIYLSRYRCKRHLIFHYWVGNHLWAECALCEYREEWTP